LLLFFTLYCAILFYVYTGKQRARRLESYKYIPFQDEAGEPDSFRKGADHE
jgi:cbb3-type cytochrome oxidase subunit 3